MRFPLIWYLPFRPEKANKGCRPSADFDKLVMVACRLVSGKGSVSVLIQSEGAARSRFA